MPKSGAERSGSWRARQKDKIAGLERRDAGMIEELFEEISIDLQPAGAGLVKAEVTITSRGREILRPLLVGTTWTEEGWLNAYGGRYVKAADAFSRLPDGAEQAQQ